MAKITVYRSGGGNAVEMDVPDEMSHLDGSTVNNSGDIQRIKNAAGVVEFVSQSSGDGGGSGSSASSGASSTASSTTSSEKKTTSPSSSASSPSSSAAASAEAASDGSSWFSEFMGKLQDFGSSYVDNLFSWDTLMSGLVLTPGGMATYAGVKTLFDDDDERPVEEDIMKEFGISYGPSIDNRSLLDDDDEFGDLLGGSTSADLNEFSF